MREIVDPDYDPDALQEKIGSLTEDHRWYWYELPDGSVDKIALPDFTDTYQVFRPAEGANE